MPFDDTGSAFREANKSIIKAIDHILRVIGSEPPRKPETSVTWCVPLWNDAPDRTKDEVIEVINKAIELARSENAIRLYTEDA